MLLAAVEDVLQQGCTFLDLVGDENYVRPLDGPLSASLGAHYRHTLDYFLCLIEGIRAGRINYDERCRNSMIENSVSFARQVTQELMEEFRHLSPEVLQHECFVIYSVGYEDAGLEEARSNLARETMFCVGHAIHHYSVLRLLCAGLGLRLPYEFGIAPSTLKHRESHITRQA